MALGVLKEVFPKTHSTYGTQSILVGYWLTSSRLYCGAIDCMCCQLTWMNGHVDNASAFQIFLELAS